MDTEAFRDFERARTTGWPAAITISSSRCPAAAERGASGVIGADLSPRMVALAASLHPGVEFREADAEALPFDAGAFDAVVSNFGGGHFPSPERAMAEFVRVRAGGGMAAASAASRGPRPAFSARRRRCSGGSAPPLTAS